MSLKLYFAGSISSNRDDAALYARLIEQLKAYGPVLTEHVGYPDVFEKEAGLTDKFIHDQDLRWLYEADVLIAEVTQASLGVGFEIGQAVALGKPVLCLFRPVSGKRLSAMIQGAHNGDTFIVKHYDEPDAADIFREYLGKFVKKI